MQTTHTRDQQRAITAHHHIQEVDRQSPEAKQKYGSMCYKLPVLVHNAGLTAALHFVAARSHPWQRRVLVHLAAQLGDSGLLPEGADAEALLARSRRAGLAETRALTREIQRCLLWYKRFTQSVLKVTADQDLGDDDETGEVSGEAT